MGAPFTIKAIVFWLYTSLQNNNSGFWKVSVSTVIFSPGEKVEK